MSRAPGRNPRVAPDPPATASWYRHAQLVLPLVVLLIAGFLLFTSTGRDDAHITYWPAYTLSHFGEIVNYNGERVEQSSSLLHVLLLALLRTVTGIQIPTLGKLSSIAAGLGTLLVVFTLVQRMAGRAAAFAGAMLVAVSPYFLYWSFGGLETTFVSLIGVWWILTAGDYLAGSRRIVPAALAMLAFATVRPESPLVLTALLAGVAMLSTGHRSNDRAAVRGRSWKLLAAGLAACGAVLAFRYLYFGRFFPQPVDAKFAGLSAASLVNGWRYFTTRVFGEGVVIALAITVAAAACVRTALAEWRARRLVSHRTLAVLYVGAYTAFTVTSGGDWMEAGRFFVFFLPVALALVPVAWSGAAPSARALPRRVVIGLAVFITVEFMALLAFARRESTGTLQWRDIPVASQHDVSTYSWFEKCNRVNMRDVPIIDLLDPLIPVIEAAQPGPVVMMTAQMGMIPYHISQRYFGRVQFIDRRGLCDRRFTDCPFARRFPRDASGVRVEYIDYFEVTGELTEECGVPIPDVIFDLRGGNTQIVSENGYSIMARQFGTITDALGEGGEVKATGFIAVRKPLWDTIAKMIDGTP
jgi:hypothetical protein